MELSSIDLSLLAAYPGTYQQALIKKLYAAFNAEATGISVMPGLKSKTQLTKLITTDGLKPFTGEFVPQPGIGYEPRFLEVEQAQRDMFIKPKDYIGTFMEVNRGKGESAENMTIPFQQVVFEAINQQTADELTRETIYNGVGKAGFSAYSALTVYTAGNLITYTQNGELRYFRCLATTTAGQNPDTTPAKWTLAGGRALAVGFGKIIADEITATRIKASQVISTGAITSTDAYAQFTAVWRGLPEVVRSKGATILCSRTSNDYLNDDYENKVSKNFEIVNGVKTLAKTDGLCRILPVNWLAGKGRIIATPSGNFWMGTDQTSDMNVLKAIAQMYGIQYGLTFMLGFQIADLEPLAVNDQA